MLPYVAVVPDSVHHTNVLPGNDTLYGGSGNDMLYGDNVTTSASLTVGLNDLDYGSIDFAADQVDTGVASVLREIAYLSMNFEIIDHAILGNPTEYEITIGQDTIDGQGGDDFIVGDQSQQFVPFNFNRPDAQAVMVDGQRAVTSAIELYDFLRDMERVVIDFGHVVYEAQDSVLDALVQDAISTSNPNRVLLPPVIDPDIHTLFVGNDTISGGDGADLLFADDNAIVASGLTSRSMQATTQGLLGVTSANREQIEQALRQRGEEQRAAIYQHIQDDHDDFFTRFPEENELLLSPYDFGLTKVLYNDRVDGMEGNDTIFGDIGVMGLTVIEDRPRSVAEMDALQTSVDTLLREVSEFVLHDLNFEGTDLNEGNRSLRNVESHDWRDRNAFALRRISNNDDLRGGAGNEVILGDHAMIGLVTTGKGPVRLTGLSVTALDYRHLYSDFDGQNVQFRHLVKDVERLEDRIDGGAGDDVLLGQLGDDVVFGGLGNDDLFGGDGVDVLDAGPGVNTVFPHSPQDPTRDPGQLIARMTLSGLDPKVSRFLNLIERAAQGPSLSVPLRAAAGQRTAQVAVLTQEDLDALSAAAIVRWQNTGTLTARNAALLAGITFEIVDLPDGELGDTNGLSIRVDATAAGHGWFIDETPYDESEFDSFTGGTELAATTIAASQDTDLMTVLMHELGHVLSLDEVDASVQPHALMSGLLPNGVRRLPMNHTNLDDPSDVNADGRVTPQDVLYLVNLLNNGGIQVLRRDSSPQRDWVNGQPVYAYPDTNSDYKITALDVLAVVNWINSTQIGLGAGEGEGPSVITASFGLSSPVATAGPFSFAVSSGSLSQPAMASIGGQQTGLRENLVDEPAEWETIRQANAVDEVFSDSASLDAQDLSALSDVELDDLFDHLEFDLKNT